MQASTETPETMIFIVNHKNISKLNNKNFFNFGFIMGIRVFLKYTKYKNGVTVFVYEKISIYLAEERILVWNLNVHALWARANDAGNYAQ